MSDCDCCKEIIHQKVPRKRNYQKLVDVSLPTYTSVLGSRLKEDGKMLKPCNSSGQGGRRAKTPCSAPVTTRHGVHMVQAMPCDKFTDRGAPSENGANGPCRHKPGCPNAYGSASSQPYQQSEKDEPCGCPEEADAKRGKDRTAMTTGYIESASKEAKIGGNQPKVGQKILVCVPKDGAGLSAETGTAGKGNMGQQQSRPVQDDQAKPCCDKPDCPHLMERRNGLSQNKRRNRTMREGGAGGGGWKQKDGERTGERKGQSKTKDYMYRCESRELLGSQLLINCDCVKRNGLQDQCLRTPCRGRPACLDQPWPDCWPSGGCAGQDYDRVTGVARVNPSLEYRRDNKKCGPQAESANSQQEVDMRIAVEPEY